MIIDVLVHVLDCTLFNEIYNGMITMHVEGKRQSE